MSRLGPQAKKLFDISGKKSVVKKKDTGKSKKYTFVLPADLMKKVKILSVEEDKTISEWIKEAIEEKMKGY